MKPGSWWLKPLWSCRQTWLDEQVVQRGDGPPPGDVIAHLQPLGVLVEHRVDDVDERLVAGEEAVPAGQEIALEPALALVLAEHLHHPPVGGEVVVPRMGLRDPGAIGHLEHVLPAIRVALIGTEQPEVPRLHVQLHHIAEESAHDPGRFGRDGAGGGHRDGVVAEIREPQISEEQAAVGVRVGAHAAAAVWGRASASSGRRLTAVVEELLGPIALHPLFEDAHVARILVHLSHRHLVRAPIALGPPAVDLLRGRSSPWACGARSSASGVAR